MCTQVLRMLMVAMTTIGAAYAAAGSHKENDSQGKVSLSSCFPLRDKNHAREIIKSIQAGKIDVNAKDKDGKTFLHKAVHHVADKKYRMVVKEARACPLYSDNPIPGMGMTPCLLAKQYYTELALSKERLRSDLHATQEDIRKLVCTMKFLVDYFAFNPDSPLPPSSPLGRSYSPEVVFSAAYSPGRSPVQSPARFLMP